MKKLAIVFALLTTSLFAQEWQQTSGPEGIVVYSAVSSGPAGSPIYLDIIFISQSGDLYENTNGLWVKFASFAGAGKLRSVGNALYATKNQQLYRSGDHGASWSLLPIAGNIESGDDFLYNVTNDSLFRSSDNGVTWQLVDTVAFLTQFVYPHNKSLISFANAFAPQLLISNDGGVEWQTASTPPVPLALNVSVADITSDASGLYILLSNGEIYRSTDDGDTWSKAIDAPTTDQIQYTRLIKAESTFWVESSNGIYVRNEKWKSFGELVTLVTADHESAIVSNSRGIYKIPGLINYPPLLLTRNFRNTAITTLNSIGATLLASAHNGIHRSTNDGNSWQQVSDLTPYTFVNDATTIYAMTGNGLISSTDDGVTWETFATPRDDQWQDVTSIASDGENIYLSYGKTFGEHSQTNWVSGGMLRSTDHGASWSNINNGLPANIETHVPVNQVIFHNNLLYIATLEGIFRSEDGNFWSPADAGIAFEQFKSGTFVTGGNHLYFNYANDFYRLESGGTWTKLPKLAGDFIMMGSFGGYVSSVGDSLFTVAYQYDPTNMTFEYRNFMFNGSTWTDITSSMPQGVTLTAFVRTNGKWFAGSLSNAVWANPGIASVGEPGAANITLYPNPAKDHIYLDAGRDDAVAIYDLLGRLVLHFPSTEQVNVASLPQGSYMVEITAKSGKQHRASFIKH